ncbi:MAG: fibronectin type III domain-containing protein, partial [Lachnospiraceae bacterium]|nr:fibronectin type III domain-containing protein [Lachnospiraceae bacterium]
MILGKKAKKLCSGIMAAMLLMQPLTQPVMVHAGAVEPGGGDEATTGRTYYFSTLHENSSNEGTEENPFITLEKINDLDIQPGDRLLLERGAEFNGQFIHLTEEGENGQEPIIIEPYGEGTARPRINTNGAGVWEQDYRGRLDNSAHKRQGNVSSSILLKDTENIIIRGLEITNYANLEETSAEFKDPNRMDRTGVAGMAQNRGTLENIILDDLYIHDVTGNIINKHMLNGGIYFICALPDSVSTNNDAIEAANVPKFDGLTIQNCHVEDVSRWGIAVAYTIYWNKFTSTAISDDVAQTYGSSNVVIKNNYLKDVGGDAITTMYCYQPLVESNVSQSAAKYISSEFFPNTNHRVAAGVWPWKCKDALFRRNECFDMQNYLHGNNDAQAWDADSGDGTIYEYNYSHGNSGGVVMFCAGQAYKSTFRYNISQNDERGMLCIPGNPDAHVYNNTFYIKEGVNIIPNDFKNGVAKVENNIFYYAGS